MSYSSAFSDNHTFRPASSGASLGGAYRHFDGTFKQTNSKPKYEGATKSISNTASEPDKYPNHSIGTVVGYADVMIFKLLKRIREVSEYTKGWNGETNSLPANQEATDEAESFLSTLPLSDIQAPNITLSSDGEINFYWKTHSGALLDLGFYGEGFYSFYFKNSQGKEIFGNDVPYTNGLSSDIIHELRTDQ